MFHFEIGERVQLNENIYKKGVLIPKGTELEVFGPVSGEFDTYRCDLDGWAAINVYSHQIDSLEQKHIEELTKPLDCPEETPEEREAFERLECKMDSLSRRVDLIQSTLTHAMHNTKYEDNPCG